MYICNRYTRQYDYEQKKYFYPVIDDVLRYGDDGAETV